MSASTSLEAPLLEQIRSDREEIERLEQLIMKDLMSEQLPPIAPLSPMELLWQGHRLRSMGTSIILKTESLVKTYEDKVTATKDEIAARLCDETETWTAFSNRLQEIHEYHRKHPSGPLDAADYEEALLVDAGNGPRIASTEEVFGPYLNLHYLYGAYTHSYSRDDIYCNIGRRVKYSCYLGVFSQPEKIPRKLKLSRHYAEHMDVLLEYLISFFQQTEPLLNLDRILSKVETDFEEEFEVRKVEDLENHGQENDRVLSHHTVKDFNYYTTVEELIDFEPEMLNEALAELGVEADGTLRQRAETLFLTRHARLEKQLSLIEAKVKKLFNLLDERIKRSKQMGEKKQDLEESPVEQAMGWDGKPIPYWLNKLGLGQEYKCEICGNHSYWGKTAFGRHFQEWLHQRELRCLGILDREKKFNRITSIEEAKQLWKSQGGQCKDEEMIKAKNSNHQAPAGVTIPPQKKRRRTIERMALIVSKRGKEHEKWIIAKYGEEDAEMKFLKSSDPNHAFYQHKLAEYLAHQNNKDAIHYNNKYGYSDSDTDDELPDEYTVPPPLLEPHKFTYRLPEGITPEELDIIKLAAEFSAQYGRLFDVGFRKRVVDNHHFGFMNKPFEGRFTLFTDLVSAYLEVLKDTPLEVLKEKLTSNAADIETVLENCYHRLQWDRFHKERWVKKAREERAKPMSEKQEC